MGAHRNVHKAEYRIGVDVGGTNIAVGIVDDHYRIVTKTSVPTRDAAAPEEMVEAIMSTCRQLMQQARVSGDEIVSIGIGVPGTANQETGAVEYANNLGFTDVPFMPMIRTAFGEPLRGVIHFDNDANAAAIGEYLAGNYREKSFIMVTIGTGIGGGIIYNGRIVRGVNYAAGEFGHMSINVEDGVTCNCGRRGCWENYASAAALIRQAREAMTNATDRSGALWKLSGGAPDKIDGRLFFEAVREEDPLALKVLEKFVGYLAEGITNLVNIFQPEVIVLSGGITRAGDLFLPALKEKVLANVYSRDSAVNTKIRIADAIPDAGDVGIIGAAVMDRGEA
ncbi:glucokinase [Lachnospiraceae bacterium NK3A20]|nr:glucokinase [Lachnospiraceae bacterium NK3A20]